ncbi:heavy-metal-associated domain-containing protein [Kocuria sp. M1N1S27]|uniref:heavy-metal-associated domain-containing protein n=1 Tax=Kocuria kalidii TaxID=3376283 RepID=UPI00379C5A28
MQTTVNVSGMTCRHCVMSVTEELTELTGVESVDVDLVAGGVSPVVVTSSRELSADEIQAAVEEAGYTVA